jgi:hypothetical protein
MAVADRVYTTAACRTQVPGAAGRGRPSRRAGRVGRALALLAVLGALWASAAGAQTPAFTVEPSMARGAATAPVTIVEFSDYQ